MIIDMIRGRFLYATVNRQLDQSGRHWKGGSRHRAPIVVTYLSLPDLEVEFFQIYVRLGMENGLKHTQGKMESRLKRQWLKPSSRTFNKLLKLMRERLELTELQLQFFDNMPNHKVMFPNDYQELVATRDQLTDSLALLDR
jgi:hypothetical protein